MPVKTLIQFVVQSSSRALHCLFAFGPCCRFVPSCSEYSAQAFRAHGFWSGLRLTLHRLLRCHPFGEPGYDPVPIRGIQNGR